MRRKRSAPADVIDDENASGDHCRLRLLLARSPAACRWPTACTPGVPITIRTILKRCANSTPRCFTATPMRADLLEGPPAPLTPSCADQRHRRCGRQPGVNRSAGQAALPAFWSGGGGRATSIIGTALRQLVRKTGARTFESSLRIGRNAGTAGAGRLARRARRRHVPPL